MVGRRLSPIRFLARHSQEVLQAARVCYRNRGFATLSVMTIATGFTVAAVVYSAVDHVLLRSLPYRGADRLVRVFEVSETDPMRLMAVSYPNLQDLQARTRTLEGIAAYSSTTVTLLDSGADRFAAGAVTPSFFRTSGVRVLAGRGFVESDCKPGAARVAIIDELVWRRRFGADPGIVGRRVLAAGGQYEVIGVVEPVELFDREVGFWIPMLERSDREVRALWVMGRLRSNVSIGEADRELRHLGSALAREYPAANQGWTARAVSMREEIVGPLRRPLLTFFATTGFVLLIACVNFAGLAATRATTREQEIAIRRALGANRSRVFGELVAESALLCACGGLLGIAAAWWATPVVVRWIPLPLPIDRISVDFRVATVVTGVALLSGALAGLGPAIRLSRVELINALSSSKRSLSLPSRRFGVGLVFTEVALSMVVLAWAGLMVRTLVALSAVDPGFDTDHTIAIRARPIGSESVESQGRYEAVVERLTSIPKVSSVALIDSPPFGGATNHILALTHLGRRVPLSVHSVSPRYFESMGMRLVQGRDFWSTDMAGAPPVVIVSQATATRMWGTANAVGREMRLLIGGIASGKVHVVVGVVPAVHHRSLDRQPTDEIYMPLAQRPQDELTIVARSTEPAAVLPAIRAMMSGSPDRFLIERLATFNELVTQTTTDRRSRAMLLTTAATLSLILAAVGVFGVTGFAAAQRAKEVSIRVALGATPKDIVVEVVGVLCLPIVLGVAAGLAGAWATTGTLKAFLFGVESHDAITLGLSAAVVGTVALVAAYVPARRILRIDPAETLRIS